MAMAEIDWKERYSTAETKRRFPVDDRIRRHGYEIESRPSKGAVLWKLRRAVDYGTRAKVGEIYSQEEVLEMIAAVEKGNKK